MKRPYRLSREAKTDLLQTWNYLAGNASFDVADKVISEIRAGMDKVGRTPGIGHSRSDLTNLPVKFYRVHSYLIIYTPAPKPIGIVRILHGSRDISSILHGN